MARKRFYPLQIALVDGGFEVRFSTVADRVAGNPRVEPGITVHYRV